MMTVAASVQKKLNDIKNDIKRSLIGAHIEDDERDAILRSIDWFRTEILVLSKNSQPKDSNGTP